jgi:quinol monooxygenase YgiN
MSFKKDCVDLFLKNFNENKQKIRNFEGCQYLELWQDETKANVFCTHSHWNSAEDLEKYRKSELFKNVWAYTKTLFDEKPLAFSVISKEIVDNNS